MLSRLGLRLASGISPVAMFKWAFFGLLSSCAVDSAPCQWVSRKRKGTDDKDFQVFQVGLARLRFSSGKFRCDGNGALFFALRGIGRILRHRYGFSETWDVDLLRCCDQGFVYDQSFEMERSRLRSMRLAE
jgi:hypothetical protein